MEDEVMIKLIESIAQEEKAIATILSAESEKLKKIAGMYHVQGMLTANDSAICLVEIINKLEYLLKEELVLLKKYME